MPKEYKVPEEIAILMDTAVAFGKLMDKYVRIPFCFNKAKKCAITSEFYNRKFWTGIRELYPDLWSHRTINYDYGKRIVWVDFEKEELC